jgi:inositol transport system substrate-binding protein
LAFLPILIAATASAGCGSSSAPASAKPATTTITIGFLVGDTGNTGQARVWKSAQAEAKKQGVKLLILNSNRDVTTESNNMDSFIAEHVNVVIDDPQDINGSIPAILRAEAAGIPVITEDDAVTGSGTTFHYVGSDYVDGAGMTLAAQYVTQLLGGKGNVVLLEGPVGILVQQLRTQYAQQTLATAPGIQIVYDQQCSDWNEDGGTTQMEDALAKNPNPGSINAVLGEDGPIAMGAVQALIKANRLTGVITAGTDGNADELESIITGGGETFTVFQQKEKFGVADVDDAIGLAKHQTVAMRTDIPWILINSVQLAEQYLKNIYGITYSNGKFSG